MKKHLESDRFSHEAVLLIRENPDSTIDYCMIEILETLADLRYHCNDFKSAELLYKRAGALMQLNASVQAA